jgi:TPR repeat protein
MSARPAPATLFRRPPRRRSAALGRWVAVAPTLLAIGALAVAQTWSPPPVAADLQAAMSQADAGQPEALLRLADSGRPDAQFYAAVMFITGRGGATRDPARGCAYAEKAAASRADALHLSGECYRQGAGGKPDPEKAKAAFQRAAALGYPKSRCALGRMLMAEPANAAQGLALCKASAEAGDLDAQLSLAEAYFTGRGAAADHAQARAWYQKAADQKDPQAARRLGEMYAAGDGGKRDTKKAVELWRAAEQAGDPLACILVADQLFSDLTGGQRPGPGKYAFKGGVPVADIEVVESWYREAQQRDPRPDVKQRAAYALSVLDRFKLAAQSATVQR